MQFWKTLKIGVISLIPGVETYRGDPGTGAPGKKYFYHPMPLPKKKRKKKLILTGYPKSLTPLLFQTSKVPVQTPNSQPQIPVQHLPQIHDLVLESWLVALAGKIMIAEKIGIGSLGARSWEARLHE